MGREAEGLSRSSLHRDISLFSFKGKTLLFVGIICFSQLGELETIENHRHTCSPSLKDVCRVPHTHIYMISEVREAQRLNLNRDPRTGNASGSVLKIAQNEVHQDANSAASG